MKTVLLMRHAKSSWDDSSLSDHERPLNKRGKRDAPKMGELLSDVDLVPDGIMSSTAKRAKMTVKGFLEVCPFESEPIFTRQLYHADVDDYLALIRQLDEAVETILLVGHNPGIEYFLEEVCGENEHMPTAAIAHILFDIESWSKVSLDIEGMLENVWRPKELS